MAQSSSLNSCYPNRDRRSGRPGLRALRRTVLMLAVSLPLLTGGAAASERSELLYSRGLVDFHAGRYSAALQLFDQAVAADATDTYARYYRGVTQGRLGNYTAAVTDLRAVLAAKPDLDQGALELGVALTQTGAYADAVPYLEQAQRVSALDGEASFFLGLAQLRLGQPDAARANFQRAAARDPQLGLSSRYYLGVTEYQARNWPAAQEHFNYVATTSPNSEMGHEASTFLTKIGGGAQPAAQPYQVYGAVGFQYDTNVAFAPSEDQLKPLEGISKQSDGRATITAGGAYAPWRTENAQFSIGYEFYQSLHFDLTEFNLQDHRPSAQLLVDAGPLRFGLYGRYDFYLLETESFLQQGTVVPSVTVAEGDFGRTEVFYRLRRRDFFQGPFKGELSGFMPSGVLDSFNHAPGVRQYAYLGSPNNYVFVGYRFDREDPVNQAGNSFAYDGHEGAVGMGWALPADITVELNYALRYEDYARQSQNPVFAPHGRLDRDHQIAFAADKQLTDNLVLTLGYFGIINDSNDRRSDYDRNIVSLSLGVRF